MKDGQLKGYIQVFIAGSLWGTVGVFSMTLDSMGVDSLLAGFLRVGFAFFIMLALTIGRFGISSLKIGPKAIFGCILVGLVSHGMFNAFYMTAVLKVGVTTASVMLRIAPVFTVISSVLLFRERITGTKGLSLVINIIGCMMAVAGGAIGEGGFSILGILCGLGAGASYGMLAIFVKLIPEDVNPFVISTYGYFFAGLFLMFMCKPWDSVDVLTLPSLSVGFLFALVPTALGYVIYYSGVQKITESSKIPVIASCETVVAAIIGVLIYHDYLGIVNITGIILVLASIALMSRKTGEETRSQ